MKLRWSHAVIYVRDLEAVLGFYCDVLGFEVSDSGSIDPSTPGRDIAFITQVGSDHHQLAFAAMRGDGPSTTLDHVAFKVDCVAEVKEMIAKLTADGRATELSPLTHGNAWSIYFKDPEGNGVEVFCDTPFHVAQPQIREWDPSMSDDELIKWTEEQFRDEPEFRPIEEYYVEHRRRFGE